MQMSQMHYLPLAPGFFAILVRAMAAIASTLCAAIMACGVASIRDLGPSDEGKAGFGGFHDGKRTACGIVNLRSARRSRRALIRQYPRNRIGGQARYCGLCYAICECAITAEILSMVGEELPGINRNSATP